MWCCSSDVLLGRETFCGHPAVHNGEDAGRDSPTHEGEDAGLEAKCQLLGRRRSEAMCSFACDVFHVEKAREGNSEQLPQGY